MVNNLNLEYTRMKKSNIVVNRSKLAIGKIIWAGCGWKTHLKSIFKHPLDIYVNTFPNTKVKPGDLGIFRVFLCEFVGITDWPN